MADVFISYSRRDQEFVRRLHGQLAGLNRDVWVDWEDIPITAEWWGEICGGIESADTFVFVITPDSLASPVCLMEVVHAAQYNKRFVPVLRRPADEKLAFASLATRILDDNTRARLAGRDVLMVARDAWSMLSRHNWLMFEDEAQFEASFSRLLQALDSDPEHIQTHTRFLVRALEWQKKERERSYLLTGIEIDAAERWLTEARDKQPAPTPLHLDYITASRAADTATKARDRQREARIRQFRWAAILLALVGIIATVASLNALRQAADADAAVKTALVVQGTAVQAQATSAAGAATANAQVATAQLALETAILAEGQALEARGTSLAQAATANAQAVTANAQAAVAGQTLAPVPTILREVTVAVQSVRNLNESLSLAEAANRILENDRDAERAALVSVRALQKAYSPQADAALVRALDRLPLRSYRGHRNIVSSVSFSPDGRLALTSSEDGTARLWIVATGQEVRRFAVPRRIIDSAAFSPDGRFILTGSTDSLARLWDATNGQELRQFKGHIGGIWAIAFSPDGSHILTGGDDRTARLWEVETGREVRQFAGHQGLIRAVAFSPDGRTILTGGGDGAAWLWDGATGQALRQFAGHRLGTAVTAVAFAPTGRAVVTGGGDGTARVWDVLTGRELGQLPGHSGAVTGVAYSRDGRFILTASDDGGLRVWSWINNSGRELQRFSSATSSLPVSAISGLTSVSVSPDNRYALTGGRDGVSRLWNIETTGDRQVGSAASQAALRAVFSSNGQRIITTGPGNLIRIWDATTFREVRRIAAQVSGSTIDFAPILALSADNRYLLTVARDRTVRLWDLALGQEILTLRGHRNVIYSVVFSPDERYVLTGSADHTAVLWDAQTGNVVRLFTHPAIVFSAAFSPDGRTILTGSGDRHARLWDIASGQEIQRFEGAVATPQAEAIAPSAGHTGTIQAVAVSPDGRWLLTGSTDATARLWDVTTGLEARVFRGHTEGVLSVAFSPDGRWLLTGSTDTTARLWDVATGLEVRRLSGHTRAVQQAAFSPDGRHLLTSGSDGIVRVWDSNVSDFLAYVCNRLSRDLTLPERRRLEIRDEAPTCAQFGLPNLLPTLTDASVPTRTILPPGTDLPTLTPSITPTPTLTRTPGPSPTRTPRVTPSISPTPRITAAPTTTLAPVTLEFTPFPLRPLPVWTPIATPTASLTPSITPTPTSLPPSVLTQAAATAYARATQTIDAQLLTATLTTFTPTATVVSVRPAQVGAQRGDILPGNGEVWTYAGRAGEVLTIRVQADKPANTANEPDRRRLGLLDTYVAVRAPDGRQIASNDDMSMTPHRTDSLVVGLRLLVDGVYQIEVRGLDNLTSGAYSLIIESGGPATGTPPASVTVTPTP